MCQIGIGLIIVFGIDKSECYKRFANCINITIHRFHFLLIPEKNARAVNHEMSRPMSLESTKTKYYPLTFSAYFNQKLLQHGNRPGSVVDQNKRNYGMLCYMCPKPLYSR